MKNLVSPHSSLALTAAAALTLAAAPHPGAQEAETPDGWWRGNLHTHSLWSDGDDFPEVIADWYQSNGYHFLMFSEHNVIASGERWIPIGRRKTDETALARYIQTLGRDWVETRSTDNGTEVRLRTFDEFSKRFNNPGRFLLIRGEEITAQFLPGPGQSTVPVHINATHLAERVIPQSGTSVEEVIRKNVRAVFEQREATGQPMFPHLNHPNFHYAVTAEDLANVTEEQFFEVYNGHPAVHNEGDDLHPGTERLWDIILTLRLAEMDAPPLYGLATDDSHSYFRWSSADSNSGRGWVMVQAAELTPESLIESLETGRFYASSGVTLESVDSSEAGCRIVIRTEPGVSYRTEFIGTRRDYDRTRSPVLDDQGRAVRTSLRYSDDIGVVLATVDGPVAEYRFAGDEVYVRARVTSSKTKANPYTQGEVERAWTQPVRP